MKDVHNEVSCRAVKQEEHWETILTPEQRRRPSGTEDLAALEGTEGLGAMNGNYILEEPRFLQWKSTYPRTTSATKQH